MSKKFLLIVEGSKTEKNIFTEIFKKYNFSVKDCGKLQIEGDKNNLLSQFYLSDTNKNSDVYIVEGPRNRIHDWLSLFDKQQCDFERLFSELNSCFAGIFIIYDVDHTSKDELSKMFERYQDETTGLLLLSSPCIEVLGDIGRNEPLKVEHLSKYKTEQNLIHEAKDKKHTRDYIIDNFESLVCYYLDKNVQESGDKNIMNHPDFVLGKINELNERKFISRDYMPVDYRYFTTVVYVCIAYIMGLTKEFDNYTIVKKYFESFINK